MEATAFLSAILTREPLYKSFPRGTILRTWHGELHVECGTCQRVLERFHSLSSYELALATARAHERSHETR